MDVKEEKRLRKVLQKVDFAHLIGPEVREKIIQKFYSISFNKGELVLQKGASAGAFLIIASGRLEVFVPGKEGGEVRVKTLGPGEYVGEIALLSGEVRNATVRAKATVKGFILGKSAFEYLLGEVPALRAFFLMVSERRRIDSRHKAENPDPEKSPAKRES